MFITYRNSTRTREECTLQGSPLSCDGRTAVHSWCRLHCRLCGSTRIWPTWSLAAASSRLQIAADAAATAAASAADAATAAATAAAAVAAATYAAAAAAAAMPLLLPLLPLSLPPLLLPLLRLLLPPSKVCHKIIDLCRARSDKINLHWRGQLLVRVESISTETGRSRLSARLQPTLWW